jgi:hypothetical protein
MKYETKTPKQLNYNKSDDIILVTPYVATNRRGQQGIGRRCPTLGKEKSGGESQRPSQSPSIITQQPCLVITAHRNYYEVGIIRLSSHEYPPLFLTYITQHHILSPVRTKSQQTHHRTAVPKYGIFRLSLRRVWWRMGRRPPKTEYPACSNTTDQ